MKTNKMEGRKFILVDEKTHMKLKQTSKSEGMLLYTFVDWLVDEFIKNKANENK